MKRYNNYGDDSSMMFIWVMWFIIIMMLLMSCDDSNSPMSKVNIQYGQPTQVVMYDGCEYVFFPCGNASWGSHKGNCKNPTHMRGDKFNLTLNGVLYHIDSVNITGKNIVFYSDSTEWVYKTK